MRRLAAAGGRAATAARPGRGPGGAALSCTDPGPKRGVPSPLGRQPHRGGWGTPRPAYRPNGPGTLRGCQFTPCCQPCQPAVDKARNLESHVVVESRGRRPHVRGETLTQRSVPRTGGRGQAPDSRCDTSVYDPGHNLTRIVAQLSSFMMRSTVVPRSTSVSSSGTVAATTPSSGPATLPTLRSSSSSTAAASSRLSPSTSGTVTVPPTAITTTVSPVPTSSP